jgi:hypothetical protein
MKTRKAEKSPLDGRIQTAMGILFDQRLIYNSLVAGENNHTKKKGHSFK